MAEVGTSVVAFQGMHGAYSEAIALQTVPGCQPRPCEHFETAFQVGFAGRASIFRPSKRSLDKHGQWFDLSCNRY